MKKIILTLLFIFLPLVSFGQLNIDPGVVSLGTVKISNLAVTSQKGNIIEISFDISNEKGLEVYPYIKYGVNLAGEKEGVIVDQYVYDDKVSLSTKTVHKEIKYEAPNYLTGNYWISIALNGPNSSFITELSLDKAIVLKGSSEWINIDKNSCYLTVQGDKKSIHYFPLQGVDVLSSENLIANCKIENHSQKDIKIKPNFETFYRSIFGDKVEQDKDINGGLFELKKGESKEMSFILPKALVPQSYDVVMTMNGIGDNISSNRVVFHYVLAGESATIQNIILDKDYYLKGEIAKLFYSITASADSFPDSRLDKWTEIEDLVIEAKISDVNGEECGSGSSSPGDKIFDNGTDKFLSINISRDCFNPVINAKTKNKQGDYLDSQEFSVETVSYVDWLSFIELTIVVVLVNIIIVIAGWLLIKRNRRFISVLIFTLFILGGGAKDANAAVKALDWIGPSCGHSDCQGRISYHIEYQDSYLPGDKNLSLKYKGYMSSGCGNGSYGGYDKMYYVITKGKPFDISKDAPEASRWQSTGMYAGYYEPFVTIPDLPAFLTVNSSDVFSRVSFNNSGPGTYWITFYTYHFTDADSGMYRTYYYLWQVPITVVNTPPSTPSIGEPSFSGSMINKTSFAATFDTPLNVAFLSTDPEKDLIRYGIDANNDKVVDMWVSSHSAYSAKTSATSYTSDSNKIISIGFKWLYLLTTIVPPLDVIATNGSTNQIISPWFGPSKIINVLAEDDKGARSGWATFNASVSVGTPSAPPVAPAPSVDCSVTPSDPSCPPPATVDCLVTPNDPSCPPITPPTASCSSPKYDACDNDGWYANGFKINAGTFGIETIAAIKDDSSHGEPNNRPSPLKIQKSDGKYRIPLVPTNDPMASRMRIMINDTPGIWALRKAGPAPIVNKSTAPADSGIIPNTSSGDGTKPTSPGGCEMASAEYWGLCYFCEWNRTAADGLVPFDPGTCIGDVYIGQTYGNAFMSGFQ